MGRLIQLGQQPRSSPGALRRTSFVLIGGLAVASAAPPPRSIDTACPLPGRTLRVEPVAAQVPFGTEADGSMLSDHLGFVVRYRLARRPLRLSFALPPIKSAADTVAASGSLLAAVAAGDVTPDEAGRVMALLTSHRALVETGDLERRIEALEVKR